MPWSPRAARSTTTATTPLPLPSPNAPCAGGDGPVTTKGPLMAGRLQYDVYTERREGLTRDLPPGNEEWRWVANTATLILGDREAVLVDTFATIAQNERLISWIRSHDLRLSAVYLTHGHGDHAY